MQGPSHTRIATRDQPQICRECSLHYADVRRYFFLSLQSFQAAIRHLSRSGGGEDASGKRTVVARPKELSCRPLTSIKPRIKWNISLV